MAALLGIGTMGTTAMAMGGGGVDRSDAVAEEERIEKVPSGKATQNSTTSSKAWKKINGVCYNGSGQKLEGAITRVFAYALMMNKGVVDLDTAVDALKDQLTDKSVYKNDVHRIQTVVCDYFKITLDDIKGKKRSQNINYPRQVAIYLCRVMANESFPKIGTYFGGRDHSTIMSSYRKIKSDLQTNEQLKVVIKELKQQLSP